MKALSGLEEKLLLKRVINGEKEAFAEVYDFYVVKIFRFIYLKTSSRETAEDITSDVFMKCWRYIKTKQKEKDSSNIENVGPLLYKIARNSVIDHYRKNQEKTVEIDDEMRDNIADKKQNIAKSFEIKQELEEMMSAVRLLKDEYQEVLILRFVEDLSNTQIAKITEKTEGTTRVLIHRALKALEKAIDARNNLRKSNNEKKEKI